MSFAGIDEEIEGKAAVEESGGKVASFEEVKKKRRPFHYWEVGGNAYKLKLTTQMIEQLEKKYRQNILNLVTDDGIPPLSTMLTVIQAAIVPWEHGITYDKVKTLYDAWSEEGGNQMEFFTSILLPTMAVSGFFTEKQAESMLNSLKGMDDLV